MSFPGICEKVESAELVINVGPLLSDSNTGGYTRNIETEKLILLAHDRCEIFGKVFSKIHFMPVLQRIVAELRRDPTAFYLPRPAYGSRLKVNISPSALFSQDTNGVHRRHSSEQTSKDLSIKTLRGKGSDASYNPMT